MREIRIIVHTIQGHTYPAPFPKLELVDLFQVFGIHLDFQVRTDLPEDLETPQAYRNFIDKLPAGEAGDMGDPGHLILGVNWGGDGSSDVYGVLLNGIRGVVAVFTGSKLFKDNSRDLSSDLLQVCAHEVGHLLNLEHEEREQHGADTFSTAMCQAPYRVGDIATAWQYRGLPQPLGLRAYPFSQRGETHFNLPSVNDPMVFPWGSFFSGGGILGGILSDRADKNLKVSLRLELKSHQVGSHLAIELGLLNKGSRKKRVPAQLDPCFRYIQIHITRPDGLLYVHRPRSFVCADTHLVLLPGKHIVQPLILLDGPGGTIFPIPGTYSMRVVMPSVKAVSRILKIKVGSSQLGPFNRHQSPLYYDRSPKTRKRFLQCINSLLKKKRQLQPSYVAHLLYLKAKRVWYPTQALALLTRKEFFNAPRALQQKAALLRARLLRHDERQFLACCKSSLNRFCHKDLDRHFHESLMYLHDVKRSQKKR